MHEKILSPRAASLVESLRDLGYSLETAIADLIDNSITAGADHISILLEISDPNTAYLAIIDNGCGMTEDELLEAMRPGSRNPREKRASDDLGRFGLGLKTASFSQCRSLTVVTRTHEGFFAAQWDLDLITERNEWVARIYSPEEIDALPLVDELEDSGTLILWQKLDRLLDSNTNDLSKIETYDKLAVVEKHLALVFHRYIAGEYRKRRIAVEINGHPVNAFDPFFSSHKATQLLPEEIVRINGHEVRIQPYILPHHSKLSKKDQDFFQSRGDFVSSQGAYVYRNGRLIAWGDWFRLVPKGETTKLARVRIDFTSALDELWTIDIKKSRARPPAQVREKLRLIVNRITHQSKRVYVGRGDRLFEEKAYPLWVRYSDREGIRYAINRDHPLVTAIKEQLEPDAAGTLDDILSLIVGDLPLEAIYADYSSLPQAFEEKLEIPYEELKTKLQKFYTLISSQERMDKAEFARMFLGLKPFSENQETTLRIIEELV